MEVRRPESPEEVAFVLRIDETILGSHERARYVASAAENGDLIVAILGGEVKAFCCLDNDYFFGKPFVSFLTVSVDARRLGVGTRLLAHHSSRYPELWTSTNRSNSPMLELLGSAGWQYCGELRGLDEGDPERFYRFIARRHSSKLHYSQGN